MTMRKPTKAQEIQTLKNEIATQKVFLKAAVEKSKVFAAKTKLTKKEEKELDELLELIRTKREWIMNATETVNGFYAA